MSNLKKPKKNLSHSFRDSFAGLRIFSHERNLIIQIVIGIAVLILAFIFPLAKIERIIIIILIGAVISTEMINTTIEKIIDHLHPEHHENIKLIKDAMASVVLLVVILAIIIGVWIFWPYVFRPYVFSL